jgi:signal transduction histidine kinase
MRERAFMLGGRLTIECASGTGTLLIAELPLRNSTSEQ